MNIILGISASIAAYKSAEIASSLTKGGNTVFPLMTKNATHFIAPLALQTLCRNPVLISLEDEANQWPPQHIDLADKADIFLIAPASADIIAKMSCGIADDVLTSTYLAVQCPILIAPAMNGKMWEHPSVQENIATLKKRNCIVIPPEEGELACGYEGIGRMSSLEKILEMVQKSQ